jgi:predicted methyltransferase
MHPQAMAWVSQFATDQPISILDLGGRDVNGTPRALFPTADYTTLDILEAPNVDIVADAATWDPDGRRWDLVLATELFEHTPAWPAICRTAYQALRPGGRFVVTTAAPGRNEHSAFDGEVLRVGEHYANINPAQLATVLEDAGFSQVEVDVKPDPSDVRATARRGF